MVEEENLPQETEQVTEPDESRRDRMVASLEDLIDRIKTGELRALVMVGCLHTGADFQAIHVEVGTSKSELRGIGVTTNLLVESLAGTAA